MSMPQREVQEGPVQAPLSSPQNPEPVSETLRRGKGALRLFPAGESTSISWALMEGVALSLVVAIVPFALYLDFAVIGHGVPDASVTETLQELILLAVVGSVLYAGYRRPEERGFLVLAAGLFGCMLLRELDYLFDYIWQGFWVWPVLLTFVAATLFARKHPFLVPFRLYLQSKPYLFTLFGLITVIIFSRLFGSGNVLWEDLMGPNYSHEYKSAIQEGLELFGYLFIGYGAMLTLLRSRICARAGDGDAGRNLCG
ncbi:hypothetical protein [Vreelandella utahensis]|uniref:hypothetical protein n=1 Tax=Vreelandella halophila TaxID=86177 RepID=UPI0009857783|nr:hypothetical protein [Halomonas utahensis]